MKILEIIKYVIHLSIPTIILISNPFNGAALIALIWLGYTTYKLDKKLTIN